jgi:hypothetical protein
LSSPHLLIHFPETVITVKFRAGNHGMGIGNPKTEGRNPKEGRDPKAEAVSVELKAFTTLPATQRHHGPGVWTFSGLNLLNLVLHLIPNLVQFRYFLLIPVLRSHPIHQCQAAWPPLYPFSQTHTMD